MEAGSSGTNPTLADNHTSGVIALSASLPKRILARTCHPTRGFGTTGHISSVAGQRQVQPTRRPDGDRLFRHLAENRYMMSHGCAE